MKVKVNNGSQSLARFALTKNRTIRRSPSPLTFTCSSCERKTQMATKTTNIEVKVDETLAGKIAGKAVRRWRATEFSDGKRRVYVTFEEVKTVGA